MNFQFIIIFKMLSLLLISTLFNKLSCFHKDNKKLISEKELAAMVSSSLVDLPSDAEISDVDDEEVEVCISV
jgi:hypothetical protein